MNDWKKRLTSAREAKGLNKTEFAAAVGVSNPTVTDWEKSLDTGGIQKISGDKLLRVCAVLSISPDWLLHGTGPAQSATRESSFDKNVVPAQQDFRSIPVISPIQAGRLREITDPYPPGAGYSVEYTNDPNLSRWAFALEIEGDSMLPEFRPGDMVIIDPGLTPRPGDYVAARNTREEATFKKYRPRGMDANGNEIFELVPLNDDYPTLRSDIEHLEVIGVMVELRKKYRRNK